MTNWSLQSRFSALLWAFSFGTLVIILTSFARHGFDAFMITFLAVGIAVSAGGQWVDPPWLAPPEKGGGGGEGRRGGQVQFPCDRYRPCAR